MQESSDIEFALKNLPKGRTNLSSTLEASTWETDEKGIFQLESYKIIEQTDTLAELEIDSRNTTVVDILKISQEKETESKSSRLKNLKSNPNPNPNPNDKRNVKQRIE